MIAMLMESLREQTQTIAGYEGRIPQIELDIVMSNLRKVYDYCSKLNMINQGLGMIRIESEISKISPATNEIAPASNPQEDVPANDIQPVFKPVVDTPEQPILMANEVTPEAESDLSPDVESDALKERSEHAASEPSIKSGIIQPEKEEIPVIHEVNGIQPSPVDQLPGMEDDSRFSETISSVSSSQHPAKQNQEPDKSNLLFSFEPVPATPQKKQEGKQEKIYNSDLFNTGTPTLGESLVSGQKPSLADKLSDQHQADQNLASILSQKNIADMKEAIGINDKFLLINELFKGNQHHYTQALHFLNNAESYDEAMGMFSRMFSELKWKEDSKAVEKLRSLISRRHGM